jgi:hypothetical protein
LIKAKLHDRARAAQKAKVGGITLNMAWQAFVVVVFFLISIIFNTLPAADVALEMCMPPRRQNAWRHAEGSSFSPPPSFYLLSTSHRCFCFSLSFSHAPHPALHAPCRLYRVP